MFIVIIVSFNPITIFYYFYNSLAMDRALPEFNRVLHKKWMAQSKRLHKQKLYESKPIIDMGEPSSLRYPIIKLKKEQLLEGKRSLSLFPYPHN